MPPLRAAPTETSQVRDREEGKATTRSPFGFRKPTRIYPNLVRSSDTPLSRSDIDASGKTIAPDDQAEEPLPEGSCARIWSPRCFSGSARLGSGTNPTAFRAALPGCSRKLPSRTAPEVPSTSKPFSLLWFGGYYPPRVREGKRPGRAAVVRHTGIASTPFLLRAPRP